MQPTLTFSFPFTISAHDAITAVAEHFGATVSINGAAPAVPAYIKQAVENTAIGIDNPENGTEMSPSIAFGGLLNGGNGNVPSFVAVGTLTTAPVVPTDISATLVPASSIPALPPVATAVVPTAPVAPSSPANGVEFDSSGLAWDERIHSGNKTKTPAGEWRTRKGTDKSLIKSVELELRAKYPNGVGVTSGSAAVAPAGTAISAASTATHGEVVHVGAAAGTQVDPNAKKAAALEYAHNEAIRVAGPQLVDNGVLALLLAGKSATISPQASEWFTIYYAKRNAAYTEFMAGNVAPAAPVALAAPPLTGANPVVSPVPTSDVSHPAGAGVPPVPTAPLTPAALGELDSTGLPWDARINLPAKIKDAAGVWARRFDVGGEVKLMVMAELRKAMGNDAAPQSGTSAAPVGGTPVAPIPPLVSAAEACLDFTKLMQWIVANQMANRITAVAGPEAAKAVGLVGPDGNGQLALAQQHAAAWPYIVQLLQAQGAV